MTMRRTWANMRSYIEIVVAFVVVVVALANDVPTRRSPAALWANLLNDLNLSSLYLRSNYYYYYYYYLYYLYSYW